MKKDRFTQKRTGGIVAELLNLEPDRADLVKIPAIGRHFLLFKSAISQKRWNFPESAYTTEQLARAVPKAILQWAKDQAKKNDRDLIKDDLKLRYKEPDGTININGIQAALRRLPRVKGIPQSVLEEARQELEQALERAHNQIQKKEGVDMPEITENIAALGNAIKGDETVAKTRDLLNRIVSAIKKGAVNEDGVMELFNSITKSLKNANLWEAIAKAVTDNSEDAVSSLKEAINKTLHDAEQIVASVKIEDSSEEVERGESADKPTDSIPEDIKKAYEAKISEIEKVAKAAQEEVARLREEKMRRDWVAKAASDFSHIGKSPDEVADLFMKLHKASVGDEIINEVAAVLKAANEAIGASGFYDTRGTDADNVSLNAFDDVRKQAESLVKEGKFSTVEKAIASIIKSNPEILIDLEGD